MVKLRTIVTHMAMEAPFPSHGRLGDWPEDMRFAQIRNMSLADYRELYDRVGRKWHWVNRRKLNDRQLAALVHHPMTEIHVLFHKNRSIGFTEFNFKRFPQAEIVLVGLIESAMGHGLGSLMLKHALAIIKTRQPKRIIIQTCTLDHPSALPLYQKVGFKARKRKQIEIIDN